jgi:hypothetical protein
VLAAGLVVTSQEQSGNWYAYVALNPGTVASGTMATITDKASGAGQTEPLIDGGFDPVAVRAYVGDTLVVSVATSAGLITVASVVAAIRPPHVVRITPPKDQLDVPINTNLTIVFSGPLDPTTVTTSTVQLRLGGAMVSGNVQVNPLMPWLVTFKPSQPLATDQPYTLSVSGAIADRNGLLLDGPVTSTFVTADPMPVASIVVTSPLTSFTGQLQLTATARDAAGNVLAGQRFTWTSSDTSIASVDPTGLLTASTLIAGVVQITATAGGLTGTTSVQANCGATCLNVNSSVGTRTVSGVFTELMADGTMQRVPNMQYYAWVQVPHEYGYSTGPRSADATGAYRMDSIPDGVVAVMAQRGALVQSCMATGSTEGHDAVINVTVVDAANPKPERMTTAPAVTGTVYRLVNGIKTPVAGALLLFGTWVPDLITAQTYSDSNGHYAFCNLQFNAVSSEVPIAGISAAAPGNETTDQWGSVSVSGPGTVDIIVP